MIFWHFIFKNYIYNLKIQKVKIFFSDVHVWEYSAYIHGMHADFRGQHQVLALTFCPVWDMFSICLSAYQASWQTVFWDSFVSTSHLVTGTPGLQVYITGSHSLHGFTSVAGVYPWVILFILRKLFFFWFLFVYYFLNFFMWKIISIVKQHDC